MFCSLKEKFWIWNFTQNSAEDFIFLFRKLCWRIKINKLISTTVYWMQKGDEKSKNNSWAINLLTMLYLEIDFKIFRQVIKCFLAKMFPTEVVLVNKKIKTRDKSQKNLLSSLCILKYTWHWRFQIKINHLKAPDFPAYKA